VAPANDDERALVVRLRASDVQAFERLVDHYLPRLARFAAGQLGSYDAAQDVVQSVLVRVWNHRVTLDPDRSFTSYIFRAVRNRILDERKADAVRERYTATLRDDAESGAVHAVVPNPERRIVDTATVQAALLQLSERRRLAIRLRFEEEMTHAEIAEVLELTPETAQRLVSRAIAELRERLGILD